MLEKIFDEYAEVVCSKEAGESVAEELKEKGTVYFQLSVGQGTLYHIVVSDLKSEGIARYNYTDTGGRFMVAIDRKGAYCLNAGDVYPDTRDEHFNIPGNKIAENMSVFFSALLNSFEEDINEMPFYRPNVPIADIASRMLKGI